MGFQLRLMDVVTNRFEPRCCINLLPTHCKIKSNFIQSNFLYICNNLMGFQLRLMDVVTNRFVGGDSDKVIAELAAGLLRGDNVFQLHSINFFV